jgi:hypothetical protein
MARQDKLTRRQKEVLEAALKASDGWIAQGSTRIWGIAPTAITALERKGYLQIKSDFLKGRGWYRKARLTDAGREVAEQLSTEELPQ